MNHKPTGFLVVLGDKGGKAEVGKLLTARPNDIKDADGIGFISWQWLRNGKPIAGATEQKYRVTTADEGAKLNVRMRYTDGAGNQEQVRNRDTIEVPAPVYDFWEALYLKHIGEIHSEGLAWWRKQGEAWFVEAAQRDGTLK